jgi:hypothetical protein
MYIHYWLWACGVWVFYYLFKAAGLASTDLRPTPEGVFRLLDVKLFFEFTINMMNTIFIMVAAHALSSIATAAKAHMRIVNILVCIAGTVLLQVFFSAAFSLAGVPVTTWVYLNSIVSSFVAGLVLILFFHRLSRQERVSPRLSALALWTFFGYTFLQSWYPSLFTKTPNPTIELLTYGTAMILKIVCTMIVFYSAEQSLPSIDTGGQAESAA